MTPLKTCDHVGCQKLVPYNERYCSRHKKQFLKRRKENPSYGWNSKTRKEIYSKYQKFYKSAQWRHLSRLFREKHPLCAECLKHGRYTQAKNVDHIIPIRVDWSKRFDEENLQSLCIACHKKKSQEDILKFHLPSIREENKNSKNNGRPPKLRG